MFSFPNSWSPTAFSQKENMTSRSLFFLVESDQFFRSCSDGFVYPFQKWRSPFLVEEAVEKHHHGSGPDTWGMNEAARIMNQGKGYPTKRRLTLAHKPGGGFSSSSIPF
jgi:hypothetical protein